MGSSVCRARMAVEQITKSGAIFARLRYAAIIFAVCRPRLLRGLSWSFRPGSFQLDLAWRSRYGVVDEETSSPSGLGRVWTAPLQQQMNGNIHRFDRPVW